MQRQIIRIDESKCDGCGICCDGCPEGALQLIDGKARLVSEITCDGLGACVAECPQDAITVETREAAPYDERLTLAGILPKGMNTCARTWPTCTSTGRPPTCARRSTTSPSGTSPFPSTATKPVHQGCPGAAPRTFERLPTAGQRLGGPGVAREGLQSQLAQWPIQLHLISPLNPVFQGADLLLVADCVAFAMADFNQRYLPGKKLAIACPKLDQGMDVYLDKLTALIADGRRQEHLRDDHGSPVLRRPGAPRPDRRGSRAAARSRSRPP